MFETLKIQKFKKLFPDKRDSNYFHYRKNIAHKFFKNLHVIVG